MIHRIDLRLDGEEVLDQPAGRRTRHATQKRNRNRIESIGRYRVASERRAARGCSRERVTQRALTREITCSQCTRRNGKRLRDRPIDPLALVAEKKETPVANDRATDIRAELMLLQRRYRLGRIVEVVPSVEFVGTDELERAAVKRIAARLRDHIDQR